MPQTPYMSDEDLLGGFGNMARDILTGREPDFVRKMQGSPPPRELLDMAEASKNGTLPPLPKPGFDMLMEAGVPVEMASDATARVAAQNVAMRADAEERADLTSSFNKAGLAADEVMTDMSHQVISDIAGGGGRDENMDTVLDAFSGEFDVSADDIWRAVVNKAKLRVQAQAGVTGPADRDPTASQEPGGIRGLLGNVRDFVGNVPLLSTTVAGVPGSGQQPSPQSPVPNFDRMLDVARNIPMGPFGGRGDPPTPDREAEAQEEVLGILEQAGGWKEELAPSGSDILDIPGWLEGVPPGEGDVPVQPVTEQVGGVPVDYPRDPREVGEVPLEQSVYDILAQIGGKGISLGALGLDPTNRMNALYGEPVRTQYDWVGRQAMGDRAEHPAVAKYLADQYDSTLGRYVLQELAGAGGPGMEKPERFADWAARGFKESPATFYDENRMSSGWKRLAGATSGLEYDIANDPAAVRAAAMAVAGIDGRGIYGRLRLQQFERLEKRHKDHFYGSPPGEAKNFAAFLSDINGSVWQRAAGKEPEISATGGSDGA